MKKILCLIDGLSAGGAQRQLVGLAKLLQDNGYEVLFVWYHETDFYRSFLQDNKIPYKQFAASKKLNKFWKVLKVTKEYQPDTIIAYIDGPTMASCVMKMLGLKTKIIVSERAVIQNINRHQRFKFFLYRWADFVVSNAQDQTNLINANFKALRSKTITIRNFVDTEYFIPKNNVEDSSIRILVVGRLSRQKNMICFMKAIRQVLDDGLSVQVKWFGGKSDRQKEYINETFRVQKELYLNDAVQFLPPTNDILSEYQKCDVFCLPSLYKGFPNVICEAMSCGKPILCSDVNDNSFVVHHNENGLLFNPTSAEDIAAKIKTFCLKSLKERDEMGKASRRIAMEQFSGESFVNKYIQLIES